MTAFARHYLRLGQHRGRVCAQMLFDQGADVGKTQRGRDRLSERRVFSKSNESASHGVTSQPGGRVGGAGDDAGDAGDVAAGPPKAIPLGAQVAVSTGMVFPLALRNSSRVAVGWAT